MQSKCVWQPGCGCVQTQWELTVLSRLPSWIRGRNRGEGRGGKGGSGKGGEGWENEILHTLTTTLTYSFTNESVTLPAIIIY